MTRAIVTALLLAVGLLFASPGCGDEGVGDPCTPEQEYDPGFLGFDQHEVNTETKSFQCRTRVCLVNHFRGRVSCPYGQGSDGSALSQGAGPCQIPGTSNPVTGAGGAKCANDTDCVNAALGKPGEKCDVAAGTCYLDPRKQAAVQPQCIDRITDRAVYCSCRCADKDGNKPADQTFCDCPSGFSCTQLVAPTGTGNEGLTGAYCIKSGSDFNPNTSCNQGDCDPVAHKCQ